VYAFDVTSCLDDCVEGLFCQSGFSGQVNHRFGVKGLMELIWHDHGLSVGEVPYMSMWPRLCKIAVQNALGQEACTQMMAENKTCICSSAGVPGLWLHYLERDVAWL
jgi:hypothetical protein